MKYLNYSYYLEYINLLIILMLPLISSILILLSKKKNDIYAVSIWTSVIIFLLSLFWLLGSDNLSCLYLIGFTIQITPKIVYSVGIDNFSIFFVILTTFLIIICLIYNCDSIYIYYKEYVILLLILEFLLLNVFLVQDLLFFYIFFESVLIPMFIIIGIWGSRNRKVHAAYLLFFYTFLGSIFMLISIIVIYSYTGTYDMQVISQITFSKNRQLFLWLCFFLAFSIKVPMFPFHIWLPEAHVEAPTVGSILLAGVLLKLGTYGMLRILLILLPYASYYFTPLIYLLSSLAIIYCSFTTLRQIDIKKIIAYSSVVHMNVLILGLFAYNIQGIIGSVFLMLSHGLVSGALFLCVGLLYDRYHTKLLKYYGGLTQLMPLYCSFLLFFTLANMGMPGTSSFIGEFLIFLSVFKHNYCLAIIGNTSMVLGAIYSIWLYNRICFGKLSNYIFYASDVTRKEFILLCILFILVIFFGINPALVFDVLSLYVYVMIH